MEQVKRAIYKGFSTEALLASRGKSFRMSDKDIVNRDLINHIYTIPGERVMMPDFGTRIPLMAFEPLDQRSIEIIEEDLRKVFEYDPRVELTEIAVLPLPDNNAIIAVCDILYLELQVTETLRLEFTVGA